MPLSLEAWVLLLSFSPATVPFFLFFLTEEAGASSSLEEAQILPLSLEAWALLLSFSPATVPFFFVFFDGGYGGGGSIRFFFFYIIV